MKHYLIRLKNGRQFGVLAQNGHLAVKLALEVVNENFARDVDKDIEHVQQITFYHKNGRVTE